MMRDVVVIGGGFAGLSAGVALAERGARVTILEARPRLGGRASSFRDAATGTVVDNGQHALMGCYRRTLAFLERIGAGGKVHRQESLHVDLAHPRLGAGVDRTARPGRARSTWRAACCAIACCRAASGCARCARAWC